MNRTFKFRVWDSSEKRFIEWYNADPYIKCATGGIFCHERTKLPDGKCVADRMDNTRSNSGVLTVQQFTGLTDSNSVDIYEGDIVRFYGDGPDVKDIFAEVKFGVYNDDEGHTTEKHLGWYLKWKTNSAYAGRSWESAHSLIDYLNKDGLSVRGNIFENSSLLENSSEPTP